MNAQKGHDVKQERCEAACWSCLGADNLRNMHQTYRLNGKMEIYADMLAYCFSIQIEKSNPEWNFFICAICIVRLRQSFDFKTHIENARRTFQSALVVKENNCSDDDDIAQDVEWLVEFDDSETTAAGNDQEGNLTARALRELSPSPEVKAKEKGENDPETKKETKQMEEAKTTDAEPQKIENIEKLDKEELKKRFAEHTKARKRLNYHRWLKKLLPYKLDGTELQCSICKETFPIHKSLKMHMPVHFPNHVCETCGKGCATKPQLKNHLKSHKPREPCPLCQKLYKAPNMRAHIRRDHEGHTPHRCGPCNLSFPNYYSRNRHMVSEHGLEEKRYLCKVCPKRFGSSQSLTTHTQLVHLQIRKCSCTICGAKFDKKFELRAHMVTHGCKEPYECEYCHKKYAARKTLKEHLKSHLDIKDFTCDICNKSFTQKSSLNGHLAMHRKELRSTK